MKKSEDVLTLKYIPLDTVIQWTRNTKKHDIPTIIKSIERHGFRDPLGYDAMLNNGAGGIVEGNGRDLALKAMFNQNPKKPPRGIILQERKWLVPVLFGVDAKSQAAAEAYGLDHNLVTLSGADMNMGDMMKMFEDSNIGLLQSLNQANELPVSVSAQDLDALLDADREELGEREETIRDKNMLRILISVPASVAMDIQKHVDEIKKVPGVEVDVSGN